MQRKIIKLITRGNLESRLSESFIRARFSMLLETAITINLREQALSGGISFHVNYTRDELRGAHDRGKENDREVSESI